MKVLPRKKVEEVVGFNAQMPSLFRRIHRPTFADTLRFPEDVTQLSAANVSDLHGKYTQLFAFANQELSLVNVRILELQTAESLRINAVFRDNPSLNQQERWRRDAVLDTDIEMEKIHRQLAMAKAEREMTQMYIGNFDRYLVALSRELSRKSHEQDLGRRSP